MRDGAAVDRIREPVREFGIRALFDAVSRDVGRFYDLPIAHAPLQRIGYIFEQTPDGFVIDVYTKAVSHLRNPL